MDFYRESKKKILNSSARLVGFQAVLENSYLGIKYAFLRKRTPVVLPFLLCILERPVVLRTGTYFEVSRWMD